MTEINQKVSLNVRTSTSRTISPLDVSVRLKIVSALLSIKPKTRAHNIEKIQVKPAKTKSNQIGVFNVSNLTYKQNNP